MSTLPELPSGISTTKQLYFSLDDVEVKDFNNYLEQVKEQIKDDSVIDISFGVKVVQYYEDCSCEGKCLCNSPAIVATVKKTAKDIYPEIKNKFLEIGMSINSGELSFDELKECKFKAIEYKRILRKLGLILGIRKKHERKI